MQVGDCYGWICVHFLSFIPLPSPTSIVLGTAGGDDNGRYHTFIIILIILILFVLTGCRLTAAVADFINPN